MDGIDRIAPTRRPDGPAAGSQKWRELVFLHWPVPVSELEQVVPRSLTIDVHEGVAYVGIVAFAMLDVRTSWMPEVLALDTLETNVRTYVHRDGRQPGVWFFSLDAESLAAVLGARLLFGLPYYLAKMHTEPSQGGISYGLKRFARNGPEFSVRYRLGRALGPAAPGSLEFWLAERYLLYVERRGRLYQGQVHHPPYALQAAEVEEIQDGLIAAAGLTQPSGLPPLVHYAAGVDVEVFNLKICD